MTRMARMHPGRPVGRHVPQLLCGQTVPVKGMEVIAQSPPTAIFILTTSHVMDQDLPQFAGADALITNALAYLSHDDTLIGIQSKGDIIRPLKPDSPPRRKTSSS